MPVRMMYEEVADLFSAKILERYTSQAWPSEDTDAIVSAIDSLGGRMYEAATAWNRHTDNHSEALARRKILSVAVDLATLAMVLAESTGALDPEESSPPRRTFDRALPSAVERLGEIAGVPDLPAGHPGRSRVRDAFGTPSPLASLPTEPEDLAEALERGGHTLPGGHLPGGRVGDILGDHPTPVNPAEDVARQLENVGTVKRGILRVVQVAIPMPEEQTDFSPAAVRDRFNEAAGSAVSIPHASNDLPVVLSRDDIMYISQYIVPPVSPGFTDDDVSVMADILYEYGVDTEVVESEARAALEKIYARRAERLSKSGGVE